MKIALTADQLTSLKAFLASFEDAEQLAQNEYVVDLYDAAPPISIDLILQEDSIFIEGAAELRFDEELDGWYIDARIEDGEAVARALSDAGAFAR